MREKPDSKTNSSVGLSGRVPWHVIDVRPIGYSRLAVTFADGTRGEVDLSKLIARSDAGVFESLRDPATFSRVGIVRGAVSWPNGVDLAPDAMYDEIKATGRWVP
jgi:hypothetical protein